MKAAVFAGKGDIRVEDVPEPTIREPHDALVAVKKTAICASDLHVLHGRTPGMREGSVIGHEFVGTIVELGDDVARLREDARVVGSFLIACGECPACTARRFNFCAERRALGLGTLNGDLDGAQAELVRVPKADVNLRMLDGAMSGLSDEQALFGGDILTTGFYGAAVSEIQAGDVVVVVGAGPVGLFCALAAARYPASKVVVIDLDEKRVAFARDEMGLEAIHVGEDDAPAAVAAASDGAMANVAIEAVGAVPAFKSAIKVLAPGGRVTVVGVYGAERYDLSMGRAWMSGLDIRFAGMANIQAHWDDALLAVAKEELQPVALISHRLPLEEAPTGYELFEARKALKVVLTP